MTTKVCVVGSGIIGLSTALHVLENLPAVELVIIGEHFSPDTTGDGAAGFWEPYEMGNTPHYLIKRWGQETLNYLYKLTQSSLAKELGMIVASGYKLAKDPKKLSSHSLFEDSMFGFRELNERELQLFQGYRYGLHYTSVFINAKMYLPWLLEKVKKLGGKAIQKKVGNIIELVSDYDVIVNCTGLGSYDFVGDHTLYPIRGQVLRVHAPWINQFYLAYQDCVEKPVYVLPGINSIVLGGTVEKNNWNTQVNKQESQRIFNDCVKLVPSLTNATVLEEWVGLRPGRPSVRLESEFIKADSKNILVVHNYGHGGGGLSLFWGCAREAAQLVANGLDIQRAKL